MASPADQPADDPTPGRLGRLVARLPRALRPTSLRAQVLTVTALLASVALVLAVGAFGVALDRILYGTATTMASSQAEEVARALAAGEGARTELDNVATHGSLIQVVGAGGHVVAATETSLADTPVVDLAPGPGQVVTRQLGGVPGDQADPYAVVVRGLDAPTTDGGTLLVVASPLATETRIVKLAVAALSVLALALLAGLLWLIDRVLRGALGRVEQIRSSVDDITSARRHARVPVPPGDDEITALAVTMNSMLGRLEQADTAQRTFVGNASHELRSPLTTIRMITEISPGGIDADGTQVVAVEAARMQRLVDDLLTLAKADDDGLGLRTGDVDLDEIVLHEARRVRAMHTVDVDSHVAAARATGDAARLAQVVHNLVDNAVRHARTTVRLRARVDAGRVVVDVDNDGPPVPVADRELVFDRFARLQDSRDRDSGGSGLGLAIVRALTTAHGGTVVATEAEDGWCRFRVELPAQEPLPLDDDLDDLDDLGDLGDLDDLGGGLGAPGTRPHEAPGGPAR